MEVAWFSITDDGELLRESTNVTITSVLPMGGKGSMAGTKSPALFSSLEFAQDLQSKFSKVNMMRISLTDEDDATGTISEIEDVLDSLIDAEDSGFEITTEGDSLSISNGEGLGRLNGDFMSSWSENKSELLEQGNSMEVLQVPLIQIQQGGKIMSLPDDRIEEILVADEGIWYVSGGAVSFQKQRGGSSHEWQVPDGGLVNDVTIMENSLLVAHSDGLVEVFTDSDKDEVPPYQRRRGNACC